MDDRTPRALWRWAGLLVAFVAIQAGLLPPNVEGVLILGFGGLITTTTTMDAALKIIFSDAIVSNVVSDTELLKYFPNGRGIKRDRTTGGRYIETSQMFALPSGVGFRNENDYIPVPRGPTLANSRINLKKILGAVEMTSETLKRVRTDVGAYVAWGREALPRLVERVVNEVDRASLGYAAGVKARVNEATPGGDTTLIVDSPMGIGTLPTLDALYHFLANEEVVAGPNIDGTGLRASGASMVVTDLDWANNAVTIDAAMAGLADDDYIFPGDASGHAAGKEAMGLFGIIDDGGVLATFQNIARTAFQAWKAQIIDAQVAPFSAGQKLTEKVVMYADDLTFQRGGGIIDLFVTSRQGIRQVWSDLIGDRSLNDPTSIQGGRGRVSILLGDRLVPVRVARKMPQTIAFGLTLKTFKKFVLHEWQWDDQTGSIWKQVTDSTGRKDAYWAYGAMLYEVANTDPQKNFRIENMQDDAF